MEKIGYSVYLSERVNELLEEGTLSEIFDLVDKDLRDEWVATPPQDPATRESIYHTLHALSLLRIKLETVVAQVRFPSLGDNYDV